jgi:sugar O-acyltransferase (sialic acid O-acetyltransferase NeuD family)
MKKIVIIGASGLAREIWDLINVINRREVQWDLVGFYDDAFTKPTKIIGGAICFGPISLLENENEELSLVFGIANRETVSAIVDRFANKNNFNYPNLFHPNVETGFNFKSGKGNIVAAQTIFTTEVEIGNFNFFNTSCGVGHDVLIGDFNCFMPRVQISGNVKIGNKNNFFMSSMIVQSKTIGDKNIIFASTLLTKSIKDNRTYFGVPGKKIPNL